MVVEQVSGMTWADYLQRNIFDPLGMSASSVDKKVAGLAVGYSAPDARWHARDLRGSPMRAAWGPPPA